MPSFKVFFHSLPLFRLRMAHQYSVTLQIILSYLSKAQLRAELGEWNFTNYHSFKVVIIAFYLKTSNYNSILFSEEKEIKMMALEKQWKPIGSK